MKKMKIMKYVITILALTAVCASCIAANITYTAKLAWDYQTTNMVFRIYVASGLNSFTNTVSVTNALTASVANLPLNMTNRFFATAFDTATGLESDPSNILTNLVSAPPPPFNLIITAPIAIKIQ